MERCRGMLLAGAILLSLSCDEPAPSSPKTTPQSPQVSPATLPATQPAREPSSMMIDQARVEFPPVLLRLSREDNQFILLLCSDDPKEAFKDDYRGNSFYIELPVTTEEALALSGKTWVIKTRSSERTESLNGIFLDGNRKQLQPDQVTFRIDGDDPEMTLTMGGTFLEFDTRDEKIPPRLVPVSGRFVCALKR